MLKGEDGKSAENTLQGSRVEEVEGRAGQHHWQEDVWDRPGFQQWSSRVYKTEIADVYISVISLAITYQMFYQNQQWIDPAGDGSNELHLLSVILLLLKYVLYFATFQVAITTETEQKSHENDNDKLCENGTKESW